MITLITGLPGSGKTLKSIEMMLSEYKDREKYVANFSEIDYEKTNTKDWKVEDWQNMPDGAVLFIDECWQYFDVRPSHVIPPAIIKQLAVHRHSGYDIVLITQGANQIDAFVRSLVDRHLHCMRPFGYSYTRIIEYQGLCMYPADKRNRDQSVGIKRWKFDKKLFGLYKSASEHTQKKRIPFKLIISAFAIFAFFFAMYNVYLWASDFLGDDASLASSDISISKDTNNSPGLFSGSQNKSKSRNLGYSDLNKPAVPGVPWSAPKYAELRKPTIIPRPFCIRYEQGSHGTACQCYTQQATKMFLSSDMCNFYVDNGFFDDTRSVDDSREFDQNDWEDDIVSVEKISEYDYKKGQGRKFGWDENVRARDKKVKNYNRERLDNPLYNADVTFN